MEHFRRKGQPPLTEEQKRENREHRKQAAAYQHGVDEQRRKEFRAAAADQRRREAQNTVQLILTDKEHKLLNLALNPTATENEWQTALIKFGESLRSRTLKI
jgi:hypothetical protein